MASKIRDRIVKNAIQCFALKGYHGCSTKDIASKADVTEGSLFRLHGSKEKLFDEALASALASKKTSKQHLRIVAFAMLEGKGMNDANRKAISRLAKRFPFIRELCSVCK